MSNRQPKVGQREFYMTTALGRMLEEASRGKEFIERVQIQDYAARGIDHYRKQSDAIPESIRPDVEHSAIDRLLEEQPNKDKATCKKGCNFCCHTTVQVTNSEARQMALMVLTGAAKIDMARLQKQAAFEGDDLAWWAQPAAEKRCVFLGGDGLCTIYEKRPTSCRKYLVASPPEHCSEVNGHNPLVIVDANVEIMASGFADLDKNQDPLPKAVFRELHALSLKEAK